MGVCALTFIPGGIDLFWFRFPTRGVRGELASDFSLSSYLEALSLLKRVWHSDQPWRYCIIDQRTTTQNMLCTSGDHCSNADQGI